MGDDDKFICLSLWRHGVDGHRASLRDRLEHIWHIIKRGHPYTDTVLLKPKRAHELGSQLCRMAEEIVKPKTEGPELKPKLRAPTAVKVWPKRKLVEPFK